MDCLTLLSSVEAQGGRVELRPDDRIAVLNHRTVDPSLLSAIREHKAELLEHLRAMGDRPAGTWPSWPGWERPDGLTDEQADAWLTHAVRMRACGSTVRQARSEALELVLGVAS